ncbi:hypothetical protein T492DRAFT_1128138 [Pavlovales sp. CCMP2436]|nr:hypothetical protein T492DRAFT_1128138 [Pavlovales sp. CCMP2436]
MIIIPAAPRMEQPARVDVPRTPALTGPARSGATAAPQRRFERVQEQRRRNLPPEVLTPSLMLARSPRCLNFAALNRNELLNAVEPRYKRPREDPSTSLCSSQGDDRAPPTPAIAARALKSPVAATPPPRPRFHFTSPSLRGEGVLASSRPLDRGEDLGGDQENLPLLGGAGRPPTRARNIRALGWLDDGRREVGQEMHASLLAHPDFHPLSPNASAEVDRLWAVARPFSPAAVECF